MTNVQPIWDLEQRLARALGTHDVDIDDRELITMAYLDAGGPDEATWNDLPADVRAAIERVEKQPQTSGWDDPFDVPADLS